jgi:hypothetical protein
LLLPCGWPLFLPLPLLVLPPDGEGAAWTGAGDEVVTGGAEVVVTGGAAVVVAVCVVGVTTAGLALCTVLWCATFFGFGAGSVVFVVEVVDVVAAAAAAGVVELVVEPDVPPQPATAMATAIVLRISFFMVPAPSPLPGSLSRVQDTSGAWMFR